jgi:hypothetical protein
MISQAFFFTIHTTVIVILEFWRETPFEEAENGVEQFLRPSDHHNPVLKMFVKSSQNPQQQRQQQQQLKIMNRP